MDDETAERSAPTTPITLAGVSAARGLEGLAAGTIGGGPRESDASEEQSDDSDEERDANEDGVRGEGDGEGDGDRAGEEDGPDTPPR